MANLSSSNMEFHGAEPSFTEAKCRNCRRLTQYPRIGKAAGAVAVAVQQNPSFRPAASVQNVACTVRLTVSV